MKLFEPLQLRELTLKNRITVSPMCQYSSHDGFASDYHLIHLGRFALGGFGLVMVEATAVAPEGRITHGDLGIWSDEHIEGYRRIATALKANGAVAGIQLAHSGPKGSSQRPWQGNGPVGEADLERGEKPWTTVSASDRPHGDDWPAPHALSIDEAEKIKQFFVDAARRADAAGFDVVEVHCAHGYLLNSFLSPITNVRTDEYGGDREGRMRFPLRVVQAVRAAWPAHKPLFVRVSAVDGVRAGGVTIEDTIAFARHLKDLNVDIVDCTSGGITPRYHGHTGYGYQVPYAARVRSEAGIGSMAVGLIVEPHQAERVVATGQADLVALGREALNDPNWPLHARATLRDPVDPDPFDSWPVQERMFLAGRAIQFDRLGPLQQSAERELVG